MFNNKDYNPTIYSSFINISSTSLAVDDFIKLNQSIDFTKLEDKNEIKKLEKDFNEYLSWRYNYIKGIYKTHHIILWIFTIIVVILVLARNYFFIFTIV